MIKAIAIAATIAVASVTGAQAAEVGIRHESGASHRSYTHGTSDYAYQGSNQRLSHTVSGATEVTRSGFGQVADDVIIREGANNVTVTGNPGAFDDVLVNGDSNITLETTPTTVSRTGSFSYTRERGQSSYNGSESSRFSGGENSTFSQTSVFAR